MLPRETLLAIEKSFISTHFDYDNVIYDQSHIDSFRAKLESYKYKAALVMTEENKGALIPTHLG